MRTTERLLLALWDQEHGQDEGCDYSEAPDGNAQKEGNHRGVLAIMRTPVNGR
jgi:hypothetical protein